MKRGTSHDLSPADLRAFRRSLLRYFERGRRDLPWRGTKDPYAVLVSEVMLQQTRVETVVPYFEAWMVRFPTASALAATDPDDVLKLWEGLGYYSRARNLHRAVREVEARYGGRIPSDPAELRTLPGVGPYTAGAVASIAFDVPAPAVDGNARRVLARLADDPRPTEARLERWASALVDPDRPGDFNQALMELGSTVCAPRRPRCGVCPVARFCRARAAGTAEERPERKPKRDVPRTTEAVAIVVAEGGGRATATRGSRARSMVLLRKRPPGGLLGGMWELPGVEVTSARGARRRVHALAVDLVERGEVAADGQEVRVADLVASRLLALPPLEHAFSHRRVTYLPFLALIEGTRPRPGSRSTESLLRWVDPAGARRLALPVAQRKLLDAAWERLGVREA